jgi:uncharacterized protein involved in response to NO
MVAAANRGLWRAPHLSLFLLASLWAGLVPLVWLLPDLVCDPVAWHRQELTLGVAGAAMGGYLLSALPHWIGQSGRDRTAIGPRPRVTQALVLAWILGRLLGGRCLPDELALVGLCLYPAGLALALAGPVVRARAWGRVPMALAPLLLVLIAFRLRLAADSLTAVLGMALLVALVGGRIVPAFLRARAGGETATRLRLPAWVRLADLMLALAMAAHLADVGPHLTGALLLLAALGQALRMASWPLAKALHGGQTDLVVLVIAWLWLPVGLALTGLALHADTGLMLPTAQHALSMGLMGSMVLAVMARAWMRRVPGALQLGAGLGLGFALLQLATVLRLVLPATPAPAALCWSLGWGFAVAAAGAALIRPVPQPVLSARRRPAPPDAAAS